MPVKILEVNDDNDGRRLDNYLMSIYKNIPKSFTHEKNNINTVSCFLFKFVMCTK